MRESKLKAENLASQKEEMNRQRRELELEIKNLKEKLKQYENELVV